MAARMVCTYSSESDSGEDHGAFLSLASPAAMTPTSPAVRSPKRRAAVETSTTADEASAAAATTAAAEIMSPGSAAAEPSSDACVAAASASGPGAGETPAAAAAAAAVAEGPPAAPATAPATTAPADGLQETGEDEPSPKRRCLADAYEHEGHARHAAELAPDLASSAAAVKEWLASENLTDLDVDSAFDELYGLIGTAKAGMHTLRLAARCAKDAAERAVPGLAVLEAAATKRRSQQEEAEKCTAKASAQLDELLERVRMSEAEAESARAEAEAQQAAAVAARGDRTEVESGLAAARAELQRAEVQLDAAQAAARAALQRAEEQRGADQAALRAELQRTKEQAAEAAAGERQVVEEHLSAAKAELNQVEEKCGAARASLAEAEDRCRHLEKKATRMAADIEAQKAAVAAATEAVEPDASIESKLQKAEQELEAAKCALADFTADGTKASDAEASLNIALLKLQQVEEERDAAKAALSKAEAALRLHARFVQEPGEASVHEEATGSRKAVQAALKEPDEASAHEAKASRKALQAALQEAEANREATKAVLEEAKLSLERAKQQAAAAAASAATPPLPAAGAPPAEAAAELPPPPLASLAEGAAAAGQAPAAEAAAQPPVPAVDEAATAPAKARAKAVVFDLASPGEGMARRASKRLHVATGSDATQGLAGEYKLIEGMQVNGRPVYRLAGSSGRTLPFLVWLPREGGCWVFTTEAPQPAEGTTTEGAKCGDGAPLADFRAGDKVKPLARSTQLAWTALPDELMATSWTKASWGERRQQINLHVIRA